MSAAHRGRSSPSLDPLPALARLLEQCRVTVEGRTTGSGFLVAPGFVLSSAHVTGTDPARPLTVVHAGVAHRASLLAASAAPPRPGEAHPFPDLAVLELTTRPPHHPCVWLDTELPSSGTTLTVAGRVDPVTAGRTAEFRHDGRTDPPGGPLLELLGAGIDAAHSGGPVLSHRSGGVCAVVGATRRAGTPQGGHAVPVAALRLLDPRVYRLVLAAHDTFHLTDHRWRGLADRLADRHDDTEWELRAADRRFLALLAELTAPGVPAPDGDRAARPAGHTGAFLAAAAPGTPPPRYPLLAHRDVYLELAAHEPAAEDELPHELAYCADLVRTLPASDPRTLRLRDELLLRAGQLGLGEQVRGRLADPAEQPPRPSVIGRIRHSVRDHEQYHVMVWRFRAAGDIVPAGPESPAVPLPEALQWLRTLLPAQLEALDTTDRDPLVELILPREALDEDFAGWQPWPGLEWWTLGRKHQLVVRPLERHEEPRFYDAWQRRWGKLAGQAVGEALVCVCGRDLQRQTTLDAAFNTNPELTALALAGSPRSGPVAQAYRVALASGVPVMLWQRGAEPAPLDCGRSCGAPGLSDCPDGRFLHQARAALADTHRDAVPHRVCQLRNEAELHGTSDEPVGERVVLLWDDPARQIPRTRLTPAGGRAEEGRQR
ncbi:hypothetical protein ACGFX4_03565 [Kitasatospora sp. NPDC048365]|uniref:VMAP-C domain-containing protein n=1 Tax=Kitasatospora sp. NPDC048365 TaxID=3364050 RepID=UPI0037158C50